MPITVYVVRRLGWEYGDDFYYRNENEDAPVRSYLSRERAEADRRERDLAYAFANGVNPLGFVDLAFDERSTLPPDVAHARLTEAGLVETGGYWTGYERLSDDAKRAVWAVIDRLQFHEVVAVEVEVEG